VDCLLILPHLLRPWVHVSIRPVVLIELLWLIALFSWCISVCKEIEVQLNLTWTLDSNMPNSMSAMYNILGALEKHLRKPTYFHVCPSVTIRLPLDGFSRNFMSGQRYRKNPSITTQVFSVSLLL